MQEMWVWSLGQEDPLEEGMVTHSSVLAWRIPWTVEPGRLQSIGWQKVGQDWSDKPGTHVYFYSLLLLLMFVLFCFVFPNSLDIFVKTSLWTCILYPQVSTRSSFLSSLISECKVQWITERVPSHRENLFFLMFYSCIAPPLLCQKKKKKKKKPLPLIHHKLFYIFLPTIALLIRPSRHFLICGLFLTEMYCIYIGDCNCRWMPINKLKF